MYLIAPDVSQGRLQRAARDQHVVRVGGQMHVGQHQQDRGHGRRRIPMERERVPRLGSRAERNRPAVVEQEKTSKGPDGFGRRVFHIRRVPGTTVVQVEHGLDVGSGTSGARQGNEPFHARCVPKYVQPALR